MTSLNDVFSIQRFHCFAELSPSHQLTWKCTDPCRKTTFLLERANCCTSMLVDGSCSRIPLSQAEIWFICSPPGKGIFEAVPKARQPAHREPLRVALGIFEHGGCAAATVRGAELQGRELGQKGPFCRAFPAFAGCRVPTLASLSSREVSAILGDLWRLCRSVCVCVFSGLAWMLRDLRAPKSLREH